MSKDASIIKRVRIIDIVIETLNAKTFVVDDKFASIGSFNFDSLSFNLNYEANVISHQPLFIDQVAAYFEEDK